LKEPAMKNELKGKQYPFEIKKLSASLCLSGKKHLPQHQEYTEKK